MTNNRVRSAVEELLAEGMAQMEAGITFAKAATDPLDKDFKGLNQAKSESDDAEEARAGDQSGDDQEQPGEAQAPSGDDPDDAEQGDPDEDTEEGGDPSPADSEKPAFLAKADDGSYVDATPILEALDSALSDIRTQLAELPALRGQVNTLAKSVQSQGQGVLLMAKAIAPNIDAPLMPKSKQGKVTVPTAVTVPPTGSAEVFSKAQQALDSRRLSPEHIAMLEQSVQQYGVEGARNQIPHIFAQLEA